MPEETRPIAIIPSDCFRWQPRVQFIDSFRTRDAALNCALEHGHNLIVERNGGKTALFDVLDDPNGACTAGLELESLQTEEVLLDPYTGGWTSLILLSIWHLAQCLAAAISALYFRQIAPALRNAASRRRWADFQRALRLAWYRHAHWGIRSLNRRLGAAASLYRSEIAPHSRRAASRYWWSGSAVDFRRLLHRHSQGNVRDLAKRLAAIMSSLYSREIAPRLRRAVSTVRQTDFESAFERAWTTSLITGCGLTRRSAASVDNLYTHKIAPRLSQAIIRFRQADIQGVLRRAWGSTLLTAICVTDQFATAVAALYVRQVAPRLRHAAARYQQADIEGALCRSVEAVAPPPQSNASQLD